MANRGQLRIWGWGWYRFHCQTVPLSAAGAEAQDQEALSALWALHLVGKVEAPWQSSSSRFWEWGLQRRSIRGWADTCPKSQQDHGWYSEWVWSQSQFSIETKSVSLIAVTGDRQRPFAICGRSPDIVQASCVREPAAACIQWRECRAEVGSDTGGASTTWREEGIAEGQGCSR